MHGGWRMDHCKIFCHLRLYYNILQYICCAQRRSRCQGESGGSSWQPVASRRAPHTFCRLRLLGTNKLRQERKVSQRSLRTFCQLKLLWRKICQMTKARIIALSNIKTPKTVGAMASRKAETFCQLSWGKIENKTQESTSDFLSTDKLKQNRKSKVKSSYDLLWAK